MTDPAESSSVQQPHTSAIDRTGDALARHARLLVDRLRSLPSETWGVAAALGALVLLMIALALASGDESSPAIPDNTPADLREPLTELHQAVNGDDE